MGNKKFLFKGKLEPVFPLVLLFGKTRTGKTASPYHGLSLVDFESTNISVGTIGTYETQEINAIVNIVVYEGYPDDADLLEGKISASGTIEVGKKNLSIGTVYGGEIIIPWPAGETAVMVILNNDEVLKGEVRNVTFFLEYRGKKKRPSGLPRFIPPE